MEIQKKNNSVNSINKFTSTEKTSKNIIIPKLNMKDHFKNKIKHNYLLNAKLPSIKWNSTKNSSKYNLINDFHEFSNNNKLNSIILNKNNIYSFNNKSKDNSNKLNNIIYEYKFKNISKDYQLENNKNIGLKKSSSAIFSENPNKLYSIYKVSNILNFHKNLMEKNKFKNDKIIREKYSEMKNEENNEKDSYINSIVENKNKKGIKTGIFGPSNNIVSVIRAKMERLKYDNVYKGVNEDIKELIKDEIMDAQVKLKREPRGLIINKNYIKPLYLKKMDKYRYLSSMNKIRELNQISIIPVLEKDKNIMLKLFNDAFDIINKKENKH